MPTLSVHATPEAAIAAAAAVVIEALRLRPNLVLGLATGATMRPFHAALAEAHAEGAISFARATIFNLDDHVGVAPGHPQSFRRFMQETLFDLTDVSPECCFMPDGLAPDLTEAAAEHERLIAAAGGIDLQILGLGRNGHIAYNEPGASHASRTRVVDLAPETVELAAADFAPDPPPRRGLTVGIGTILDARRIVLVATGEAKASAVRAALTPPPREDCPASALQHHADTLFCLDAAAAAQAPHRIASPGTSSEA